MATFQFNKFYQYSISYLLLILIYHQIHAADNDIKQPKPPRKPSPAINSFYLNKLPDTLTAISSKKFDIDCYIYDFKHDYEYYWLKNNKKIESRGRIKIKELIKLPDKYQFQYNQYLLSLQRNGDNTSDNDYNNNFAKTYGSRLSINFVSFADKAEYTCVAKRLDGRGKEWKTTTKLSTKSNSALMPLITDNTKPKINSPRCEKYNGNYCSLLKGRYILLKGHQRTVDIEDEVRNIVNSFMEYVDKSETETCSQWLQPATCLYVFDLCSEELLEDPSDSNLEPVKLCRQDCELLTYHNCKAAFTKFRRQSQEFSVYDQLNCTKLKSTYNSNSCIPSGMAEYVQDTQSCYDTQIDNNSILNVKAVQNTYFGLANTAIDGSRCQNWNYESLLAIYPKELAGGHNFCRAIKAGSTGLVNHASLSKQEIKSLGNEPWCMTANGPKTCGVEACSLVKATVGNNLLTIILSVLIAVLVVLIACIVCCCIAANRRKNSKKEKLKQDQLVETALLNNQSMQNQQNLLLVQSQNNGTVAGSFIHQTPNFPQKTGISPINNSHNQSNDLHNGRIVEGAYSSRSFSSGPNGNNNGMNPHDNSNILNNFNSSNLYSNIHNINPEFIHKLAEIGDGNFGKVHLAKILPNSGNYNPGQPVLIKTVEEENMDENTEVEFVKELQNRIELQHSNLICLKAFVRNPNIWCLIYEYTEFSTLHKSLVASRLGIGAAGVPTCLEFCHFSYIIRQLTDVMAYLEDKGYTHRDLACRNIMVMNTDFKIKLASLGMMRRDYMTDYAKLNWLSSMPFAMPIRWMSPESLKFGTFSSQSDVWSFGIVLYEIFSFGNRPWAEFSNDTVIELVATKSQILPKPIDCPENIYSIMKECWNSNPELRPNFEKLKDKFMSGEIFEEGSSTINNGSTIGVNCYGNMPNSVSLTHNTTQNSNLRHNSEYSGIAYSHSKFPPAKINTPIVSPGLPDIYSNNHDNGYTPLLKSQNSNNNNHNNQNNNNNINNLNSQQTTANNLQDNSQPTSGPTSGHNSGSTVSNSGNNMNNVRGSNSKNGPLKQNNTPSTSLQSASLSNYSNCGINSPSKQKQIEMPSSMLGFNNLSEHLNL